ncbi:ATP-dependent dethiobiotin synthetase BioD [Bradyrhizobium sp. WSM1743]|uniref:ATP-dependent dethiobiotin synthetase BioD n=1 Tax=Bradyrhizobium sp. WSM1743 TaxID=318996 RepID=UPI00056BA85A|nr:ATP-dependent dethiobiotin synthetase BioD [Bradyrhizobium sp. WSM1743]
MTPRIVITGTDTRVGKKVFSAGLAELLGASYWKPIQAGFEGETDAEAVGRLGRLSPDRIVPELYRLRTPASPHHSAEIDGESAICEIGRVRWLGRLPWIGPPTAETLQAAFRQSFVRDDFLSP